MHYAVDEIMKNSTNFDSYLASRICLTLFQKSISAFRKKLEAEIPAVSVLYDKNALARWFYSKFLTISVSFSDVEPK